MPSECRVPKERPTHPNADFQRIARRDKKAFLSDTEENNRMGKTRDIFNKIVDTKGTFHAKMDTVKDRNGMDLEKQKILRIHRRTIQKRSSPPRYDGVITHLEPDILECEVKWALESITTNKASGGDGIPVELFQILKDDAVKVLHSICQQIWKTQQWPQDWKGQFSFQSQRKAMPKNAQTTSELHSSHPLVK